MCLDGAQWKYTFALVPNAEKLVVRRGQDVRVLPIPFYLSSSSIPLRVREDGPVRRPQVPLVHKRVYRACCQDVGVMGGEIDVRNGPGVRVECERRLCRMIEVPYQRFLVRSTCNQSVSASKGRPLYVGNLPQRAMGQMSRRRIWIVQIDDVGMVAVVLESNPKIILYDI